MQHSPWSTSGLNFIELAQTFENFGKSLSKAHPRFYRLILVHPVCVSSMIRIDEKPLIFCIPHYLINCMQMECISAVSRQNPIKYAPNIQPNVFQTFHYTNSSCCCFPIFSSLKPFKPPPKDKQVFNRFWKSSSLHHFSASKKIPFFEDSPVFFPTLELPPTDMQF